MNELLELARKMTIICNGCPLYIDHKCTIDREVSCKNEVYKYLSSRFVTKKQYNEAVQFQKWRGDKGEFAAKLMAKKLSLMGSCFNEGQLCDKPNEETIACEDCIYDHYMSRAKEEIIPF